MLFLSNKTPGFSQIEESGGYYIGVDFGSKAITLSSASPRDNTLRQSIEHLCVGSGLYPTIYKSYSICGDGIDRQHIEYLCDDYVYDFKIRLLTRKDEYKTCEIRLWLQKRKAETAKYPLEVCIDRSRHEDYKIRIP